MSKTIEELEVQMFLDELEAHQAHTENFYKRWGGKTIPIEAESDDQRRLNSLTERGEKFFEEKFKAYPPFGHIWSIGFYRKPI